MEAVEAGILRRHGRQLKLGIADSLTVSSRLKLGADVTREAVQGRVNKRRFTEDEARRTAYARRGDANEA